MSLLGWIIYKSHDLELKPELYEVNRLIEEAKAHGIELIVLKPEQIDLIVTKEDRKSILVDDKPTALPDFVLPRMGAGTTYFALAVIRQLERLGVPSFNNSDGIDTVKDKLYTHQILAQSNLPVPKTMLVKFPVDIALIEKHIGFPAVIKTLSGSQGKGVFLVKDKQSCKDLFQLLEITNAQISIIIQEFIETSFGRDLRVFTVGGRVVACMERKSNSDDFKANYSLGGIVNNFPISPEIEWLAVEVTRLLGLDIAGVDLLFDHDHYKICEVNSSPGFQGIESCCNVNIPKEMYTYLKLRLGDK